MVILMYMSSGFDTHGPSNHLLKALMEDLLDSGHHIKLIENITGGENPYIPKSLEENPNFEYSYITTKKVLKNAFIKRYINYVRFAMRSIKLLKKYRDVDVVFVQSCPSAPFQVSFAKRYVKKPIVYNVQDVFPGSSIAVGVMPNKLMQKFFSSFHKIAYRKADRITVISEDMKQKILDQGVSENKMHTIVNWYDNKSVHEVATANNRFIKKYDLDLNKFFVQYAGGMGQVFDYKMIISVAEILKDYVDIEFQMIGQGSLKDAFIKLATEKNLTNIKFYPLEPQDMVSDVYSACNISIIPLIRGVIGNSVPSKAALLMACKRPIINSIDEDTDYYNMFNDNNIGVSVSNNNPEKVAEAIFDLYMNKDKVKILAENAYEFGAKYYSRPFNTNKYNELFLSLGEKK